MLCLEENEIKGRKKSLYSFVPPPIYKFSQYAFRNRFCFCSSMKQQKNNALLKFNIAKTALFGKIYSLKPLWLVGEGSVINGDTPSSFERESKMFSQIENLPYY